MVMISDDGDKTPANLLWILPISLLGMLALKRPWTVLTWAKSGPLIIGSGQKIASGKRQVGFNPTFAWPAEPVSLTRWWQTLDSPAVLANECDKSLIIAKGIAAFCRCGKNAVSINRA